MTTHTNVRLKGRHEIAKYFGVNPRTVSSWFANGLPTMEERMEVTGSIVNVVDSGVVEVWLAHRHKNNKFKQK